MSEALHITVLLIELYIAFGVMLTGFGYMVAGKVGGGRVASFYFGRSLRWAGNAGDRCWTGPNARSYLLPGLDRRPFAYGLWRGMRWLVGTRQRSTMVLAVLLLCALTWSLLHARADGQTVTVRQRTTCSMWMSF